ncbi:hypothetical protein NEOLEDRAFT_1122565 [Neolentinus lepideus HHB14362 ss-1]|uniref:P-loop containing nucleoside triphosphate hydrolase protein n=1 Tax=Neolentinus lepideus HHB14362 ss-1 TaxID=1314782 RepID=A0A165P517_9AGAM|nr:hypothetical protein NEOLEDRAFT_1122565 [Neolentinus lepideus HHB14362 ss-1]
MKDLKALGAQADLQLPRIAVIGAQSAGKSSLVEAISGINVPRDSGTCTRCPMECTLTSDDTWFCQISLRFDYDESGTKQLSKDIKFGPVITDKKDVELWLRRAQAAILSTRTPPSAFYGLSREDIRNAIKNDATMAPFSKNVVCIDIHDPEATDLAFVDLPGLIQIGEGIDLIKELVEDYIAEETTYILVTIPASDDIQNQQALKLAEEADPDGNRTIGVVTKPDSVVDGDIGVKERWQNVFRGEAEDHDLLHGYFCVRLPNDQERSQTQSRAHVHERACRFFDSVAPWKDVSDRSRLGIPGLVAYASSLLMARVEKDLPDIKKKLEQLLARYGDQLSMVPPPLEVDPALEILDRITKFVNELTATVNGTTSENKDFVQRNRATYDWYNLAIRSTAPDFRPIKEYTKYGRPFEPGAEDSDNTFEDVEGVAQYETMDLYAVRKVIQENKTWELPYNVPYDAKKALIRKFVILWAKPTNACMDGIWEILSETVTELLKSHFGQFKGLEARIGQYAFEILEEAKTSAVATVNACLNSEAGRFYTENIHYYSATRSKWLYHYHVLKRYPDWYTGGGAGVPFSTKSEHIASATEQRALQALRELGYGQLEREDLKRLHPPDAFEDELIVMADVRAYFQVAYKRMIDFIPLSIDNKLNRAVVADMQRHLFEKTSLGSAEDLKRLLDEDPAITKARNSLQETIVQLKSIQKRLNEFMSREI